MKLLFFDTETSSLAPDCFIQEIAWATFKDRRLLSSTSALLSWELHYTVDPGAFETTGLSKEFCNQFGRPPKNVFLEFLSAVSEADGIVGHNIIDFDLPVTLRNIQRCLFAEAAVFKQKIIADTMFDLAIKNPRQPMGLRYLAFDHGYVLADAHQALADVMACADVFHAYPLEQTLASAQTPLVTVRAYSKWDDVEFHEKLKANKFRWNREIKGWERRVRQIHVPKLVQDLGRDLYIDGQVFKLESAPEPQMTLGDL